MFLCADSVMLFYNRMCSSDCHFERSGRIMARCPFLTVPSISGTRLIFHTTLFLCIVLARHWFPSGPITMSCIPRIFRCLFCELASGCNYPPVYLSVYLYDVRCGYTSSASVGQWFQLISSSSKNMFDHVLESALHNTGRSARTQTAD